MKTKFILYAFFGLFATNSIAENFILKIKINEPRIVTQIDDNKNPIEEPVVDPIEELKAKESFWIKDKGSKNFNSYYVSYADASSSGQVKVKINVGQYPFEGDPLGAEPFDADAINSKLTGYSSIDANGFITFPNLGYVKYNVLQKNPTGIKYFEVTSTSGAHADFVGLMSSAGNVSSGRAFGLYIGSNFSYIIYSALGAGRKFNSLNASSSRNVFQFWIDYDNGYMAIKYLGAPESSYVYY